MIVVKQDRGCAGKNIYKEINKENKTKNFDENINKTKFFLQKILITKQVTYVCKQIM